MADIAFAMEERGMQSIKKGVTRLRFVSIVICHHDAWSYEKFVQKERLVCEA